MGRQSTHKWQIHLQTLAGIFIRHICKQACTNLVQVHTLSTNEKHSYTSKCSNTHTHCVTPQLPPLTNETSLSHIYIPQHMWPLNHPIDTTLSLCLYCSLSHTHTHSHLYFLTWEDLHWHDAFPRLKLQPKLHPQIALWPSRLSSLSNNVPTFWKCLHFLKTVSLYKNIIAFKKMSSLYKKSLTFQKCPIFQKMSFNKISFKKYTHFSNMSSLFKSISLNIEVLSSTMLSLSDLSQFISKSGVQMVKEGDCRPEFLICCRPCGQTEVSTGPRLPASPSGHWGGPISSSHGEALWP